MKESFEASKGPKRDPNGRSRERESVEVGEPVFTVQQLVDQDEVVLDVLLADLAEVGGHHVAHLVEELEHHGGVDVLLGDGRQPDVGALDVEEAGAGDVGDGGAHLLPGVDHVHAERVHRITPGGGEGGGERVRERRKQCQPVTRRQGSKVSSKRK